jgi:uncharacterized membrane protein SirB2
MYAALIHSHSSAWGLMLLLGIITYVLLRLNKQKAGKVFAMILRLTYIGVLITGIWLIVQFQYTNPIYYVKGLLAIISIGLLETSLVRARKQKASTISFVIALLVIVIVILMGFGVII